MVDPESPEHSQEDCWICSESLWDVRMQIPVWWKEQWDACESGVPGVSRRDE